jgi:hypothetical protein
MAHCEVCGTEVVQGRGRARRTCSAACRQKAHRQRQAGQLAELRAAATKPALTLVPPGTSGTPAPDDSPAGRIRAAGAELADAIDRAARRAADGWHAPEADDAEAARLQGRAEAARAALAIAQYVESVVVPTILASAPAVSRDEPEPRPAAAPTAAGPGGSSRDEPVAAVPAPVTPEGPAAEPGSSRDEPAVKAAARRKRLTQKAARAVADSARLVKDVDHRDNHRWNVVAGDGAVLGHVEPSYGGTGRTGRNGWKYRDAGTFVSGGPYKTREDAAVQCALSWMRLATAPVRNTITGG